MIYELRVERNQQFDVAVIGGGTAGVFAAISAARCGAKTVLVEKNSRLGGTMTSAGVNYPGLFFAWGRQIIAGPCWEAIKRTNSLGGAVIPEFSYKPESHWMEQIRLNKLIYLKVINDMCREAGVTVMTNAMVSHALEHTDGITLLVTDKSGLLEINCSCAVDSTGDADLTRLLGYPCQKSAQQQPASLENHITGYREDELDKAALQAAWEKHPHSKKVPFRRLWDYIQNHKIESHVPSIDADLPEGRQRLEAAAIDYLFEYYRFLRDNKGFEKLQFDYIADESGVRETNRIMGEATVTAGEYVAGAAYPDSVCYAFYPIDLHVEAGILQTFLEEGVVPQIPYGALIPKNSRHLLCAGRMVSSDTNANSALRVQAPCMAMGQAAGCAAALSARNVCSPQAVDIHELRAALTALGAIVP